jgi:hypothetical protein
LRGALRTAFDRAADLQPADEFADHLRDRLRQAAVHRHRSWTVFNRWFALAASLILTLVATAAMFFNRPAAADALASDAIGDHRNCALKYRLVRTPVPLEEAARRFDSAYRLLLSAPPDDVSMPAGSLRVIDRHSCAYGDRRFGHVVLQYRGRVVSLLVTANARGTGAAESVEAIPHVIGRPVDGLSVVSVNGSRHAVVLVSDLENKELTQLAGFVSLPLVQQLEDAPTDRTKPTAWIFPQPVQEWPR